MATEPWHATVLTLYPDMFPGPLSASLSGRALRKGIWQFDTVNIRDFGKGNHKSVDDTPAGGGAGMVLRADVLASAIDSIKDDRPRLLMSPRGEPLTQRNVRELSVGNGAIIICGRFEGVDQRVIDKRRLKEISIGDYILSGGEIASFALIDACVRLLPGVMGASQSADEESFENDLLEYPHYTRPVEWEGEVIPEILSSGNHQNINAWRRKQSEELTARRRKDLWQKYQEQKKRI